MKDFGLKASYALDLHHEIWISSALGSFTDLKEIQVAIGVLGVLLLLFFLVLLAIYLWLAFGDLVVVLSNYNLRPADRCHWSSCGFYHHDEADPESAECLNPLVSKSFFDKRRRSGDQPSCRRSVQVREVKIERKPANDYLQEFMSLYSAFHPSKILWRLVTIAGGISLWALGAIGLQDFIKTFF
jgi:hypothetical protein